MTQESAAQELDANGWNVYPAKIGGKSPTVKWKQYQHERTTELIPRWFGHERPVNYWVACGAISHLLVLDVDSPEADSYWHEQCGDLLDRTACVITSKGHHYYFRLEGVVASWSVHDGPLSFDVRAEGTGVIAPPSTHANGHQYRWLRGPENLQDAPDILLGVGRPTESNGDTSPALPVQERSMLTDLLEHPPQQGGRNVWLAQVAGHYAKHNRDTHDLYLTHCELANRLLPNPLEQAEFTKTVDSIWNKEHSKTAAEIDTADEDNGYLLPGEDRLLAPVWVKDNDGNSKIEYRQWANFDLEALGVVEDEEAERTYDVLIHRKRQQDTRHDLLPATVLADNRRIYAWLAGHGVNITQPVEREVGKMAIGARLQSYIEAQNPPPFRVAQELGYNGEGFVCWEGVIDADGLHLHSDIKPNPALRSRGQWRYGFVPVDEARDVLRQVLTFHDEQVASVFGAWWAACLLKPQLQRVSSLFPFMALEAASESGKTTGMFSKLIQLAGNAQGQTSYTAASMRDAIASHRNGIVWIDDEDAIDHLTQLLRAATGEGSYTKKAEDKTSSVTVQLVAPILLSGEALQLGTQKALKDRAVMLEVPAPTKRRSLINPERLQWEDIVALTGKYPDLTCMAGTIVQMALQHEQEVNSIDLLRGDTTGRWADKMAILRVGARILAGMCDDQGHIEQVDRWVAQQIDTGNENALTMKVLPVALRILGYPDHVDQPYGDNPATPVVLQDGGVWVSVQNLALWWRTYNRGHVESRTETGMAMEQQARALGMPDHGKHRVRMTGSRSLMVSMWRLPDDVAKEVLERADWVHPRSSEHMHQPLDGIDMHRQGTL
jgi:hypothetical protein